MSTIERIIADYGQGLRRVAAAYEADTMLQEDLFQDILIAIHQSLPALREKDRLAPYIYRIAHNRSVSHVARAVGRKRGEASAVEGLEEADSSATPEAEIIQSEQTARLERAVRQLPLSYRQVVTLYLEEMAYADIAETLNITQSNVGVRLNRAKQLLKEALA